jgi:hypothetical protein
MSVTHESDGPNEMAARLAVFDETVDGLRDSSRYARLSGDPAAHSLAAMVRVMETVAVMFRTREAERRQISQALREETDAIAKSAVAQVEARSADLVEALVPRMGRLVEQSVTRRLWLVKLRTVLLAGGVMLALTLTVFAVSYGAGLSNGRSEGLLAGHTIAAAMAAGPGAAAAWAQLMASNDPVAALKSCKSERDGTGRRYCRMPVWLDPAPNPPASQK